MSQVGKKGGENMSKVRKRARRAFADCFTHCGDFECLMLSS